MTNRPETALTALADIVEAWTLILAWVVGVSGTVQAVWVTVGSLVEKIRLVMGKVAPSSVEYRTS
jgi:hypothetical protein